MPLRSERPKRRETYPQETWRVNVRRQIKKIKAIVTVVRSKNLAQITFQQKTKQEPIIARNLTKRKGALQPPRARSTKTIKNIAVQDRREFRNGRQKVQG